MEQTEITENLPVLGEHITINTYETQCTNPTCDEQIEFDTTLPTGWDLKEIKISITCPKCVDAKPAHRKTRTRPGQEARPRGHRRRDLLHVNGLTNPQLINSIEEFLPWDGDEDMGDALAELAETVAVRSTVEIPEPVPVQKDPIPVPEPKPNAMRQLADRQQQRLRARLENTRIEKQQEVSIDLPPWEPSPEEEVEEEEEEVEITNPNYGANQSPIRPIPKSEEPTRIRKRRRAVSLVADQREKEVDIHPSTINCHFCESRQLPNVEICTNCARDVHSGELPAIDEAEESEQDNRSPEIDLSSRTIKKMKKDDAIKACRFLGLSTNGTVRELKSMLTAYRNGIDEEE